MSLVSLNEQIEYGQFYQKIFSIGSYRYIDPDGNILSKIEQEIFSWKLKYGIESCKGSKYRLEEIWPKSLTLGLQTSYQIYRDDKLVATSNSFNFFDTNVTITTDKGIVVARLTRGFLDSIILDRWHITNEKPEILDNYFVGMIGALTSIKKQVRQSKIRRNRFQEKLNMTGQSKRH